MYTAVQKDGASTVTTTVTPPGSASPVPVAAPHTRTGEHGRQGTPQAIPAQGWHGGRDPCKSGDTPLGFQAS